MADVLRDNSMSTMILTSYTKSFGAQYLIDVLTDPMAVVSEFISTETELQEDQGAELQT